MGNSGKFIISGDGVFSLVTPGTITCSISNCHVVRGETSS
jgi:hypothetical protein